MSQPNADAGREWNPYELATPIAAAPAAAPQSLTGLSFGPGVDAREEVEPELAGRISRLLAQLINSALLMVPIGLVLMAGYKVIRQYTLTGEVHSTTGATTAMLLAGLLLAGWIAWNLVLLHQYGQSVGKRMIGIRIVRSDGTDAGLARLVLLRFVSLIVIGGALASVTPLLESAFTLINVLLIFTVARRCIHDYLADTIVVTA